MMRELKDIQVSQDELMEQEVQVLQAKVKELEAECEDVRQRTRKGNLFPTHPTPPRLPASSSPRTPPTPSPG